MPVCARCGATAREHYWPKPGTAREAVTRAWLTARGFGPTDRCCSRCMVELDAQGR